MYTNLQLRAHPHNHSHAEHAHMKIHSKSTWAHTKAATVWSLSPLWITLLTHIRFLKSLRSTASPILSHFHTLLCRTLTAPITASGAHSCQTPNFRPHAPVPIFPRNIESASFPTTLRSNLSTRLLWSKFLYPYSGLVKRTRTDGRNSVQCFKDPRHKSFLYGGVCPFVCVHHDRGFYSCAGDWVNEIACLPREARVPEDWGETAPSLLPGHVTRVVRKPET